MTTPSPCKWRHVEPEIIPCGGRWYRRDSLSYRDVKTFLLERDISIHHTTVFGSVQCDAPEINARFRPRLKSTNHASWTDETYRQIGEIWHDL